MVNSLNGDSSVYELRPDWDHFDDLAFVNSDDNELFERFSGHPIAKGWIPRRVTAADTDDELARFGDFALLGTIPVFSKAAVEALGPVLTEVGELLPLIHATVDFYALNVTHLVDALDESASTLSRLPSGKIVMIDRYVFAPKRVAKEAIFKIPQRTVGPVFATSLFADVAARSGLRGIALRKVFPLHEGESRIPNSA
jgi:hypothetical protein